MKFYENDRILQKKWRKLTLTVIAAVLMCMCAAANAEASSTSHDIGSGNVTCDGGNHRITGTTSKHHITIKGSNPVVTISGVTIDLSNEDNDNKSQEAAAICVEKGCSATIIAEGCSRLEGGNHTGAGKNWGYAGINIESGASLIIKGESGDVLEVYGGGDYSGAEEGGAAIGSDANNDMGDLTIEGALTIKAYGAVEAAGIGSGHDTLAGNITIKGGNIYASGGRYAAGIGAGNSVGAGDGGDAKNITISGGIIEAVGGKQAAGIGGSDGGDVNGTIKISGGTVEAAGGNQGAGIGGGKEGYTKAVEITSGNITAFGGQWAAGIGGGNAVAEGDGGDIGSIHITGGDITATGGGTEMEGGAGIGGSDGGEVGSLRIEEDAAESLSITAQGGKWGAGIGSAAEGATSHDISSIYIKLNGGTIKATGGKQGAGIGGGNTEAKKIEIYGKGTIKATGVDESCAIGAGERETGGIITIAGDYGAKDYSEVDKADARALNITATTKGISGAAAIGSGNCGGKDISIKNASVTILDETDETKNLRKSAGIGNAVNHNMTEHSMGGITIENCRITDKTGSSKYGVSIGAGYNSKIGDIVIKMTSFEGGSIGSSNNANDLIRETHVGSISIEGSKINAKNTKGMKAAIGSGEFCGVDKIIIKDSDVTAYSDSGAGIGSGGYASSTQGDILKWTGCSCGDVIISGSTVKATGGDGAAGIGGGWGTSAGSITIKDSAVEASSIKARNNGDGGAGIGGGHAESAGDITITNSKVTASGSKYSAGIGSSGFDTVLTTLWDTTCHSINISDGSEVTAVGGEGGAAIGTGQGAQFSKYAAIVINDSTVNASGGTHGAGVGAGANGWAGAGGEANNISISGASKVTAVGGDGAAGIGGGYDGGADNVYIDLEETVYDSGQWKYYVKAVGGKGAAGIGSGSVSQNDVGVTANGHNIDKVDISGGYVYAEGGKDDGGLGSGAGIGGGSHGGNLDEFIMTGGYTETHAGKGSSSKLTANDIGCGGYDVSLGTDGQVRIWKGTVIGSFSDEFDMTINGGSISCNTDSAERSDGTKAYRTLMQTGENYLKLQNLKTSLSDYGTEDVFSDGTGKVYLYLPESGTDKSTAEFCINSKNRHYYGTTTANGEGWLKMGGKIEFEDPEKEPVVGETFTLALKDEELPDGTHVKFELSGDNIEIIDEGTDGVTPGAKVQLKASDWAEYTVTASVDRDSFDSEMYWDVNGTYTGKVAHKKGAIKITENPSKIYDGETVEDPAVTISSDAGASKAVYKYYKADGDAHGEYLGENAKPVNAGTYFVVAEIPGTNNYTAASDEMKFTIDKRPAAVKLTASEDPSGTDASVTGEVIGYVGTDDEKAGKGLGKIVFKVTSGGEGTPAKEAGVSGKQLESGEYSYSASVNFEDISAGEYTVTAELQGSDNYQSIETELVFHKDLAQRTIELPKEIKVAYGSEDIDLKDRIKITKGEQDGSAYNFAVVYNQGADGNETAVVSADGTAAVKNAGIAVIKVSLDENRKYTGASAYTAVIVTRAELTATPYVYRSDDADKTHVIEASYGSLDDLSYSLVYSGFVQGDNPENFTNGKGTLEAAQLDKTTGTGVYTLCVNKVPADGQQHFLSRNYKINVGESRLTVSPAKLCITADDKTGRYGVEPEYTYSFGDKDGRNSLMPWDKPEDVVASVGLADGKSYVEYEPGVYKNAIIVKTKEGVSNYIFSAEDASDVKDGTLTVEKGDVIIDAKVPSKTYDGKRVEADVKIAPVVSDGISAGDLKQCDADIAYYKVAEDGSRDRLWFAPKDAGSYVAVVTAESECYNRSESEVVFKIHKAHLDVDTPKVPDLEMKDGLILSDQKLPSGWAWIDPDKELEPGRVSVYAVYTPDDSENYYHVVRLISFSVYEKDAVPGDDGSGDSGNDDGNGSGDGNSSGTDGNIDAGGSGISTGDSSSMMLWIAAAATMLCIIAVVLLTGRRRN